MVCSIVWCLGFNPGVCQRLRRPEPVAAQLYEALMRLFKTRARSDDRYFQLEQSIGNWTPTRCRTPAEMLLSQQRSPVQCRSLAAAPPRADMTICGSICGACLCSCSGSTGIMPYHIPRGCRRSCACALLGRGSPNLNSEARHAFSHALRVRQTC